MAAVTTCIKQRNDQTERQEYFELLAVPHWKNTDKSHIDDKEGKIQKKEQ